MHPVPDIGEQGAVADAVLALGTDCRAGKQVVDRRHQRTEVGVIGRDVDPACQSSADRNAL